MTGEVRHGTFKYIVRKGFPTCFLCFCREDIHMIIRSPGDIDCHCKIA